jgi:biopolymer transport protein ExbD
MARVKMPRSSVEIDMTPMVDMAFLLVTFFILTTQFRPDEPVQVTTPSSTSVINPQEKGKITITIAPDGRIFFDLDNQNARRELMRKMGETYGVTFSQDEINAYALESSIGMPMSSIKGYLALSPEDRKLVQQTGIPVDSTKNLSNELGIWITNARRASVEAVGINPQVLIKGDSKSNYPSVKFVFKTLQDQLKPTRFGLITSEEAEPTTAELKQ